MRSPVVPRSATVATFLGLAVVPAPVSALWPAAVNAVRAPRLLVEVPAWFEKSGVKSAPPVATNVPQSPGVALGGKNSSDVSPVCWTWQLRSTPIETWVSGPADVPMFWDPTAAPATGAATSALAATARGQMTVRCRRTGDTSVADYIF